MIHDEKGDEPCNAQPEYPKATNPSGDCAALIESSIAKKE